MTGTQDGADSYDLPEWYKPPQMIGGHVGGPMLVGRTEACVVAVRQVLAYPAGVEIVVEAHTSGFPDDETQAGPDRPWLPQPRFRVRFADGREAAQDDEAGLHSGLGPMLTSCNAEHSAGGPGNPESVRLALWVWPLPPPGPFTVTCGWPERRFPDIDITLDADAVRAAAALARPLWPDPPVRPITEEP